MAPEEKHFIIQDMAHTIDFYNIHIACVHKIRIETVAPSTKCFLFHHQVMLEEHVQNLKKQFAVAIDHDIITRNQLFNLQSSNVVEPEICVNDTNSDGSVIADNEVKVPCFK